MTLDQDLNRASKLIRNAMDGMDPFYGEGLDDAITIVDHVEAQLIKNLEDHQSPRTPETATSAGVRVAPVNCAPRSRAGLISALRARRPPPMSETQLRQCECRHMSDGHINGIGNCKWCECKTFTEAGRIGQAALQATPRNEALATIRWKGGTHQTILMQLLPDGAVQISSLTNPDQTSITIYRTEGRIWP